MSTPLNLTSTGTFGPAAGCKIGSVSLIGGSAAAAATIRDGGAGGTIVRQYVAAINTMGWDGPSDTDGYVIAAQAHLTISGTGASINIELI